VNVVEVKREGDKVLAKLVKSEADCESNEGGRQSTTTV